MPLCSGSGKEIPLLSELILSSRPQFCPPRAVLLPRSTGSSWHVDRYGWHRYCLYTTIRAELGPLLWPSPRFFSKDFFFPVVAIILALTEGMDIAVKCIYPGALSCLLLLKRFKMSPTWNISATGKGLLLTFFLLCKTRFPIQNALAELLHPGCSLDYPLVILAAWLRQVI